MPIKTKAMLSFSCECCLEVCDAVLDENVIPLDEFLDVGVAHTVLVPVGQHLVEEGVQLVGRAFLVVE